MVSFFVRRYELKANSIKYIFFTIVVCMIGLAIYFLYIDGKENVYAIENNELEINMVRELNIGISEYDTINPILSNNRDIQYINKLIFNSLIDITYDFKIQNSLAKEFSKINDTTYIVKLRDDKFWHDGEKLTSDDIVFTINNLKNNNINSVYKDNVKDLKEIQKIDDYTIKIILNNKIDFFEYMMCIPILASHAYDKNLNSTTTMPIGTGNFKITKIEEESIIIEKSSVENKSKIKKINLILKESAKDLYVAFSKGEIDFMITDNLNYEEYVGSIGYNINEYCNREFDYLVLNNQNRILRDKEIRKAINYAIDKNEINYSIYNNKYKIAEFPLNYGSYLYETNENSEYDINNTKSILAENGWTLKNNVWTKNGRILKFSILVEKENAKRAQAAENIKEQLDKVGIVVDVISVDNKQFSNYIKYKNYDMILTGNIVSNNPNLETYFGDNNLSNFNNKEVQNIISEIKNADNIEEILKEKYIGLEEIYKEEMPFISLYFNNIYILSNKNLKGDLQGNWYNLFYNIENWYKVDEN